MASALGDLCFSSVPSMVTLLSGWSFDMVLIFPKSITKWLVDQFFSMGVISYNHQPVFVALEALLSWKLAAQDPAKVSFSKRVNPAGSSCWFPREECNEELLLQVSAHLNFFWLLNDHPYYCCAHK